MVYNGDVAAARRTTMASNQTYYYVPNIIGQNPEAQGRCSFMLFFVRTMSNLKHFSGRNDSGLCTATHRLRTTFWSPTPGTTIHLSEYCSGIVSSLHILIAFADHSSIPNQSVPCVSAGSAAAVPAGVHGGPNSQQQLIVYRQPPGFQQQEQPSISASAAQV